VNVPLPEVVIEGLVHHPVVTVVGE